MGDGALRDLADDGTISMFAKGGTLLFVCSEGHWWTVEAGTVGSVEGGANGGGSHEAAQTDKLGMRSDSSEELSVLIREFGYAPLRAIRSELRP